MSEVDDRRQIDILVEVLDERDRQDEKWGANRNLDHPLWLTILHEETGEAARAILENDNVNLREELVQAAAVAVAWLECIDRWRARDDL